MLDKAAGHGRGAVSQDAHVSPAAHVALKHRVQRVQKGGLACMCKAGSRLKVWAVARVARVHGLLGIGTGQPSQWIAQAREAEPLPNP